jgi:hypothetical protein
MCEIINTYYGRPELPVGCSKDIGCAGGSERHIKCYGSTVEKYGGWVRHRNSNAAPTSLLRGYGVSLAVTESGLKWTKIGAFVAMAGMALTGVAKDNPAETACERIGSAAKEVV